MPNGAMGGPPMGANMGAPNPDALMQELQMLGQRAQEIIGELQSMGIDPSQMMAGAPQGPPAGPPMGPPVGNPMGGPPMGPPPGLL